MTDEDKRIRGYLQAQAAKLSPPALIEKVQTAMDQLREAAASVPAARFWEQPEPNEWSANEVMAHVVDAGVYFGESIVRVLHGGSATAREAREPRVAVARRTADEWWHLLQRDRAALFARVLGVDPGAHLDRTIEHPFFGTLNWRETLLFLRLHDLDHVGQLQKIVNALSSR